MSVRSFAELENHTLERHQISLPVFHVARGSGSVPLRRHCDTLSTSGFADDVMFSNNGLTARRVAYIPKPQWSTISITCEISTEFCSAIKTGSSLLIAGGAPEQSLLSMISLFCLCIGE